MKIPLLTLVLTASLPFAVSKLRAQAAAETHAAKTEAAAVEGFNATDKKIITAVAESDEAEISVAKIALQKSSSSEIKEYANTMIKDHTKSTEMLKPIAHAAGASMPDLKLKHKAMAVELEALSGDAFDKAYVKGNVKSHTEILETVEKAKDDLSNAELKKFVATVTPIIKHHLMMAKDMK